MLDKHGIDVQFLNVGHPKTTHPTCPGEIVGDFVPGKGITSKLQFIQIDGSVAGFRKK
jgi:hypothetical protein